MGTRFGSIAATGRYVPGRLVTNADLEARLGEPVDDWLVANVGIGERRAMAADQTTSDWRRAPPGGACSGRVAPRTSSTCSWWSLTRPTT